MGPSRIPPPPRGMPFGGKAFDFERVAGVRDLLLDFGISPRPPTAAEFTRRVAKRREK
jgi:hypothetical protein